MTPQSCMITLRHMWGDSESASENKLEFILFSKILKFKKSLASELVRATKSTIFGPTKQQKWRKFDFLLLAKLLSKLGF